MIGGSGGAWPGNEGVKGVDDVDGGVVDDVDDVDDGASGGLTQNGELVSPAARLTASVASAVGVGSRRGGSTVRMKLSLNSALSSGLLLLLLLLLAAMTLASQRVAQSRSSSDATTKPAAVTTSGTVSLRAMAAAGPPRYGPCALQSADQAGSSGGRYMCGFGEAKGAAGTAVWIGRAMHGSPKRRGETLKAGRRSGKRQKGSIGSGGGGGGG